VFKKDATDFDEDGFHATLLDLHEKGKIKVTAENEDVEIHIINEKGLDRYERKVMNFLLKLQQNNVIKTEYMNQLVADAQQDKLAEVKVLDLQNHYNRLVRGTDNKVAGEFTINGRTKLVPFFMFAALLTFAPLLSTIFYDNATMIFISAAGHGAITILQSIVALVFPTKIWTRRHEHVGALAGLWHIIRHR
jgi:uncharacterized membrane protein